MFLTQGMQAENLGLTADLFNGAAAVAGGLIAPEAEGGEALLGGAEALSADIAATFAKGEYT
jgi:hypothetical protein